MSCRTFEQPLNIVVALHLCDSQRLAAGFQHHDVAGFQFHGWSFRVDRRAGRLASRHDTPIIRDPTILRDTDYLLVETTYGGRWVVNPSGGLISKGHPLGATGLAQCTELVWQLRGQAEGRQVEGAKVALQHNLGLGGACVVTMYRRD